MSTLQAASLTSTAAYNWGIYLPAGNYLASPGHILQTQWVRTNSTSTFSAATSGNGVTLTPLAITIAPRSASSLLLCTWMIVYEVNTNVGFVMHQDGSLITTAGYQGYNNVVGNLRYSCVSGAMYDNDNATTPSHNFIQYVIPAGSTSSTTIAPAVRSTGVTAATFYLNRAVNAPANGVEVAVSAGSIMEIAQ